MSLETTLSDIIARLRQGRYPLVCHPEPVEGSLASIRLHPSAFIPHPSLKERPPAEAAETTKQTLASVETVALVAIER